MLVPEAPLVLHYSWDVEVITDPTMSTVPTTQKLIIQGMRFLNLTFPTGQLFTWIDLQ